MSRATSCQFGDFSVKVGAAVVAVVGSTSLPAWSQGVAVVPNLTIQETLTNNRGQSATDPRADLITQISPGVTLTARRGSLVGSLTYSLNGLLYAQDSSLNNVYHSLASAGKLSLLDGRAGIDVSASAGRQVISAFGSQSVGVAGSQGNQAQVLSYSLAPYLTGRLLGDVAYQGRIGVSGSRSDSSVGGNPVSLTGSAGLSGRVGSIGWGVDGNQLVSESEGRPRSRNARLLGSLNFSPDIEWQLTARAGTESDDIRTGQSGRTTNWGAGVVWSPGPRTTARLDTDRRFFGRSHSAFISHRMARTVFTFSDSRSLETSGQPGQAALSNYEYYMQLFAALPEAVRDVAVRDYLAQRNLDPGGRANSSGFLSNGPTVQRNQNLSLGYQGLRATLTLSAFQSQTNNASQSTSAGGDLARVNAVRQRGLAASWSHRLTPEASIVVSATFQKTPDAGTQPGNDLSSITATWSARLGPHANVTAGLRYSKFDSDINPYHESAVIGSIRMQF